MGELIDPVASACDFVKAKKRSRRTMMLSFDEWNVWFHTSADDRVKIACLAQLVNVIAPIMTRNGGPAWRQTIFYPFLHASRYGRGESLKLLVDCPGYESRRFGAVPYLEATATVDEESGEMAVFAVNRSPTEAMDLEIRLGGYESWTIVERLEMSGSDPKAVNSAETPDAVLPRRAAAGGKVEGGKLSVALEPLSWNVIKLAAMKR